MSLVSDLLRHTDYLLSETDPRKLGPSRSEVAFVGRSNVGKSSLINALCQRRGLANVSKTPGRTRMINVFAVDEWRWLVDLPGYGYAVGPEASRAGWSAMIEGYLTSRPSLRSVFLLMDGKVGPTTLDHAMRAWLKDHDLPAILIINKIDQVKPSQRVGQQKRIAEGLELPVSELLWISTTEGNGMVPLRQTVVKLLS